MAITPAQAASLSQEDYGTVSTIESNIDKSLLQQFSLASRVLVVPVVVGFVVEVHASPKARTALEQVNSDIDT